MEEFIAPAADGEYPFVISNQERGYLAEQWAIEECLRRGFRVARPVVDLDGVDLVVNYGVKVQVKSTMGSTPSVAGRHLSFSLESSRSGGGHPTHGFRLVDYFALCWIPERRWWVVPRGEISTNWKLNMTVDGRYRAYENAWDLLGGELDG